MPNVYINFINKIFKFKMLRGLHVLMVHICYSLRWFVNLAFSRMNCHRGLLVFVIKCNLNNWCFCFLHVCLKQPLCLYIKLHSSEKNIIHARMFEHYLYMMLYFVLCSLQFIKKFQGISTLADFIIRNIMCKGVRDIFLKMSLTKLALIFFILYVFLK